ncbi:MAG: hypothetical protein KC503_40630 [Myxococcales bacterium]|nr:hypothetical protein [Myxococcales bacterium]
MFRPSIIALATLLVASAGAPALATPPAGNSGGGTALALPLHSHVGLHGGGFGEHHVTRLRGRTPLRLRGRLRIRLPKKRVLTTALHGTSFLGSLGELVDGTPTHGTTHGKTHVAQGQPLTIASLMRRGRRNTQRRRRTVARAVVQLRGAALLSRVKAEVPGLLPEGGRSLKPLTQDGLLSVMPGSFGRLERAIEAMNMAGIAHGNISLSNLRVDEFGQLYLVGGWHGARSGASPSQLLADKIGLASVRAAFAGGS